jgi:hypothetical protein
VKKKKKSKKHIKLGVTLSVSLTPLVFSQHCIVISAPGSSSMKVISRVLISMFPTLTSTPWTLASLPDTQEEQCQKEKKEQRSTVPASQPRIVTIQRIRNWGLTGIEGLGHAQAEGK